MNYTCAYYSIVFLVIACYFFSSNEEMHKEKDFQQCNVTQAPEEIQQ
jgi:hypothetical protein